MRRTVAVDDGAAVLITAHQANEGTYMYAVDTTNYGTLRGGDAYGRFVPATDLRELPESIDAAIANDAENIARGVRSVGTRSSTCQPESSCARASE